MLRPLRVTSDGPSVLWIRPEYIQLFDFIIARTKTRETGNTASRMLLWALSQMILKSLSVQTQTYRISCLSILFSNPSKWTSCDTGIVPDLLVKFCTSGPSFFETSSTGFDRDYMVTHCAIVNSDCTLLYLRRRKEPFALRDFFKTTPKIVWKCGASHSRTRHRLSILLGSPPYIARALTSDGLAQ